MGPPSIDRVSRPSVNSTRTQVREGGFDLTVRPIDVQVVVNQQSNVAGQEQAQQNLASQVQSREMQKIPEKTHEQETKVQNSGESQQIKVEDKEKEKQKRGKHAAGQTEEEQIEEQAAGRKTKEDGKGEKFDATT